MLCPHCKFEFEVGVLREIQCKNCGKLLFIRLVGDELKVVDKRDADKIDFAKRRTPRAFFDTQTLFSEVYSFHARTEIFEAIRKALKLLHGKVSDRDVIYHTLETDYITSYKMDDKSGCWNSQLYMLMLFCNEGNYKEALKCMLETMIIDLNDFEGEFDEKAAMERIRAPFADWAAQAVASLGLDDAKFSAIIKETINAARAKWVILDDEVMVNLIKKRVSEFEYFLD